MFEAVLRSNAKPGVLQKGTDGGKQELCLQTSFADDDPSNGGYPYQPGWGDNTHNKGTWDIEVPGVKGWRGEAAAILVSPANDAFLTQGGLGKSNAIWHGYDCRYCFGERGSPKNLFEELPVESCFGSMAYKLEGFRNVAPKACACSIYALSPDSNVPNSESKVAFFYGIQDRGQPLWTRISQEYVNALADFGLTSKELADQLFREWLQGARLRGSMRAFFLSLALLRYVRERREVVQLVVMLLRQGVPVDLAIATSMALGSCWSHGHGHSDYLIPHSVSYTLAGTLGGKKPHAPRLFVLEASVSYQSRWTYLSALYWNLRYLYEIRRGLRLSDANTPEGEFVGLRDYHTKSPEELAVRRAGPSLLPLSESLTELTIAQATNPAVFAYLDGQRDSGGEIQLSAENVQEFEEVLNTMKPAGAPAAQTLESLDAIYSRYIGDIADGNTYDSISCSKDALRLLRGDEIEVAEASVETKGNTNGLIALV